MLFELLQNSPLSEKSLVVSYQISRCWGQVRATTFSFQWNYNTVDLGLGDTPTS
jgi:hypothetical protein